MEELVAKAASYFDRRFPGWHFEVNPDTLNLSSGSRCVIGQLAPRITGRQHTQFSDALPVLMRRPRFWRLRAAFYGSPQQELWRKEIRERRAADRKGVEVLHVVADEPWGYVRVVEDIPFLPERELVDA